MEEIPKSLDFVDLYGGKHMPLGVYMRRENY